MVRMEMETADIPSRLFESLNIMIENSELHSRPPRWQLYAPGSALLLWACLWLNLNSGFWNIQAPHSLDEWQLFVRSVLPFAVLPMAGLLVLSRRKLDLHGQQVDGIETRVDAGEAQEAFEQQAGGDHEHQGERDFNRD